MNNLSKLSIILFAFFSINSYAQVNQQWVSRYNGAANGNDNATCICLDNSGNVLVTGSSTDIVTSYDYSTVKYNFAGSQIWVKKYLGTGNDEATCVAVDNLDNVYVTGKSNGNSFVTIKYNSNGDEIWNRRYNGAGNITNYICVDEEGNAYVTGASWGGSNYNYATLKYDSSGNIKFIKIYNGTGNGDDIPSSIAVDEEGNIFVTGASLGSEATKDYLTVKYDSTGFQQWATRYNGTGNSDDEAKSLTIDSSGNVWVTGFSADPVNGKDAVTIKYNSNGNDMWIARYNRSGNVDDIANSIKLDHDGNVYISGATFSVGTGEDILAIKYNNAGVMIWEKIYNGTSNDRDAGLSSAVSFEASNDFYITGFSIDSSSSLDFITIKYDSSGTEKWVKKYNGNGNGTDASFSIALDKVSNVYVTGTSYGGSGTNYDYATIKYSQFTGLQNISTTIPSVYKLYQNFPNPFNPSTSIRFDLSKNSFVKLSVFDVTGKKITRLINEDVNAGKYQIEFKSENLPSGIYFYSIQIPGYTETKRMIILK